jgi:hypothetical protein
LQHLREVKDRLLELGEALWGETTLYVHKKRVVFVNRKLRRLKKSYPVRESFKYL